MSRNRFAATRLTAEQAHEVWSQSDEASAFTRPDYLAQLVDEVEWWGVERSGGVVAAWPLVRAVAGGEIGPPPFCYYVGPMFARSLRADSKYHRYWSVYTGILTALIESIVADHPRFRFSLPLGVTDVRVLEWWNFDHPDEAGFHISPRYTARIDLSEFADTDALRQSFARIRKREIDPWIAAPPTVLHDVPAERLVGFHDQALERSGGVISPSRHAALRRLIGVVKSGAGSIIGVVPPGGDDVEAAVILLDGPNASNGVFYAASEGWRDRGLTAWIIWLGLLRARELGLRWFDFNGANSPRRAADKHHYSAKSDLYFDCTFGVP